MRIVIAIALAGCGRIAFDPITIPGDGMSDDGITDDGSSTMLSVQVEGEGRVTSQPPGIDCPGTCIATFSPSINVTLTAAANPAHKFLGWEARDCLDQSVCTVSVGASPVLARFSGLYNIAFSTSTLYANGSFGLANADLQCNQLAAAAGLPGNYIAWLSSAASDAITRLGPASGWVTTTGLTFTRDRSALLASIFVYPAAPNESGTMTQSLLYTGTLADGTSSGADCNGWTQTTGGSVTIGLNDFDGAQLTNFSSGFGCATVAKLLCFGTDHQASVPAVVHPGRLVFLSTTQWQSGGGLASADSVCQSDANAAGHTGTYRAFLYRSAGTAESRFNLSGAPWVRVDGTRILRTASELSANVQLLAPINRTATGATVFAGRALTGLINQHCSDWTETSAATVAAGETSRTAYWFGNVGLSCSGSAALYCFEQ